MYPFMALPTSHEISSDNESYVRFCLVENFVLPYQRVVGGDNDVILVDLHGYYWVLEKGGKARTRAYCAGNHGMHKETRSRTK